MSKRIAMLSVAVLVVHGSFSLTPPKQVIAGSLSAPVVLVHGWNKDNSIPDGCDGTSTWGQVEQFFGDHGIPWGQRYSVGFYNRDWNCRDYLSAESSHCTGWYDSGGNDGTNNEDIRHVTCELAWYIWDHFTSRSTLPWRSPRKAWVASSSGKPCLIRHT